jgi:hypothetical protein
VERFSWHISDLGYIWADTWHDLHEGNDMMKALSGHGKVANVREIGAEGRY